jgi:hypothetical protein
MILNIDPKLDVLLSLNILFYSETQQKCILQWQFQEQQTAERTSEPATTLSGDCPYSSGFHG